MRSRIVFKNETKEQKGNRVPHSLTGLPLTVPRRPIDNKPGPSRKC